MNRFSYSNARKGGGGANLFYERISKIAWCNRLNGFVILIILIGLCLELRMSLYTVAFMNDYQKASRSTMTTTTVSPMTESTSSRSSDRDHSTQQQRQHRAWSPRVVTDSLDDDDFTIRARYNHSSSSSSTLRATFQSTLSLLPWNWFGGRGVDEHQKDSWIYPRSHHQNSYDDNNDSQLRSPTSIFTDQCIPQADWQTTSYPTCNLLHEGNIQDNTLLSLQGSWRTVWRVHHHDTSSDVVVLKLLHMKRDFSPEAYYLHKMDAMAMEHLTFSPYIINAFAYCGQSVVTELADSSARNVIKNQTLSSYYRLELARDLSLALSHFHYGRPTKGKSLIKHDGPAMLAHLDINIANVVYVGNVMKLNDFNLAVPISWNVTSQKPCGTISLFSNPLWKSPEEIANASLIDPDRSDVYSMGNILFQILTRHQPWTHLEEQKRTIKEVAALKLAGTLPHVPDKYVNWNKTELAALYYATMACLEPNPEKRMRASDLFTSLNAVTLARSKHLKPSLEQLRRLFSLNS